MSGAIPLPGVVHVGSISGAEILDGGVTEADLNASVAGAGLAGGAGTPLSVSGVTNAMLAGSIADAKLASSLAKRVATKAVGWFEATDVSDTDTLTLGTRVYEFDNNSTITGDVAIPWEGDPGAQVWGDIIAAAVNGDGSKEVAAIDGADIAAAWENTCFFVALTAGVAGNSIVTEQSGAPGNLAAATLLDGADAAVVSIIPIRHVVTATEAALGCVYFETGLTSFLSVALTWYDLQGGAEFIEAESNAVIVLEPNSVAGAIHITEGDAWATGDILELTVIGTA